MKTKRQNEIIRLITSGDIETQEELASALRSLGYQVTQATVSRDIRELRLIKVPATDGGFKYAKPEVYLLIWSENGKIVHRNWCHQSAAKDNLKFGE